MKFENLTPASRQIAFGAGWREPPGFFWGVRRACSFVGPGNQEMKKARFKYLLLLFLAVWLISAPPIIYANAEIASYFLKFDGLLFIADFSLILPVIGILLLFAGIASRIAESNARYKQKH